MDKLPIDIIRQEIIPYTYQPQSKHLCRDIRSFYNTRDYLCKLYHDRWFHSLEYEQNADLNWLDNDIIRFVNDDIATMLGYTENCLNKFKRNYSLNNKNQKQIYYYITKNILQCDDPKYAINIQIGILNFEERIQLVDFAQSLDFE
jgi:hypothetical protein